MRTMGFGFLAFVLSACSCDDPPDLACEAPELVVAESLAFDTTAIGQTAQVHLPISNAGEAPVTITSFDFQTIGSPFHAPSGGAVLPANGTKDLVLEFSPTRPGSFSDSLFIRWRPSACSSATRGVVVFVSGSSVDGNRDGGVLGDAESMDASTVPMDAEMPPDADTPRDAEVIADAGSADSGPSTVGHWPSACVGDEHSCAVDDHGDVYCWGLNDRGQLGQGHLSSQTLPVRVTSLPTTRAVVCGTRHTCAIASNSGDVYCWGANESGQLGNGNLADASLPVQVALTGVLSLSATEHTCAALRTGALHCWGENGSGQLGDGTTEVRSSPVLVSSVLDIEQVSTGTDFTCARSHSGRTWCWGANSESAPRLGTGDGAPRSSPAPVVGLDDAVDVAAGHLMGCAIRRGGEALCWGQNQLGQLGDGSTTASAIPVTVRVEVDAPTFTELSVRRLSTCGLRQGGSVACWGQNSDGQLGDGTRTQRNTPVPVVGLPTILSIGVGAPGRHNCAVDRSLRLWCWGSNSEGQQGNGVRGGTAVTIHEVLR